MSSPNRSAGPTRLRQAVERAKTALCEKREAIQHSHTLGLPSIQVCAKLTAAADAAILSVWNDRIGELSAEESRIASESFVLVAHGGYGRRQLAPWSDIDLMVLHAEGRHDLAERLARELTHDVFDLGLDMGHSLRTTEEALRMARADVVIATSLIESRPLVGSQSLFDGYFSAFSDAMRRRKSSESSRFVTARANERRKYGETVYLLEPNLKRSRGALRDVHLLRWLWFLQNGVSDLDRLHSMGVISKFDHHRVCSSRDFLLRVRNDLHFHAKSGSDALNREDQLHITERLGYQGTASLKPVEQFMRDYFRHASHVWFLASRLSDLTTHGQRWSACSSR